MNNVIEIPNANNFHNPLECSLDMEHKVKYYTALGQISHMIKNFGMTYEDFCAMSLDLGRYYQNWAEIVGVDIEDRDFATNIVLPSMLEPWCFDENDFDEDDDE